MRQGQSHWPHHRPRRRRHHRPQVVKIGGDSNGKIVFLEEEGVNSRGKPPGRPIFEVQYGGQTHYITVSVGDNGFIVGANIRSASTPFKDARRDPRAEADPTYRGWGE